MIAPLAAKPGIDTQRLFPLNGGTMSHWNYNHLYYFWVVSSTGSIAKAARRLFLTPQTINGQLRVLEARVGAPLFRRNGRRLALTTIGQKIHAYAEPMFRLGQELSAALHCEASDESSVLSVGIAPGVQKMLALRVFAPLLERPAGARFMCYPSMRSSLADLEAGNLDLLITDSPWNGHESEPIEREALGTCRISILCSARSSREYGVSFPHKLDGARFILPSRESELRRDLDHWFARERIRPVVAAELDDSDLIGAISRKHTALFAVPSPIAGEVADRFGVSIIAEIDDVHQAFHALALRNRSSRFDLHELVAGAQERLEGTYENEFDTDHSAPRVTAGAYRLIGGAREIRAGRAL